LRDEDEARDMNGLQEASEFQLQEPDGFNELVELRGLLGTRGGNPVYRGVVGKIEYRYAPHGFWVIFPEAKKGFS
jgi:hypothetical protein